MVTQKISYYMNKLFFVLFISTFILAVVVSYYKYYYLRTYNFLIETACDSNIEKCEYRDCQNDPDSCPPNKLSYYKSYYVTALDFEKCSDNSCKYECDNKTISCIPVTDSQQ